MSSNEPKVPNSSFWVFIVTHLIIIDRRNIQKGFVKILLNKENLLVTQYVRTHTVILGSCLYSFTTTKSESTCALNWHTPQSRNRTYHNGICLSREATQRDTRACGEKKKSDELCLLLFVDLTGFPRISQISCQQG